jgi:predicted deacylase
MNLVAYSRANVEASDALPGMVAKWADLEARYRRDGYAGRPIPNELVIAPSKNRTVVTAAHAVGHWRDGVRKGADRFTGSLAEVVAESTGAGLLVLAGTGPGDPNWDEWHPFKAALARMLPSVDVVLDLHGMRDRTGIEVCVGRGARRHATDDAAEVVAESFREGGFSVAFDHPFDARRATTVTSFVQSQGCAALQLEIAAAARNPAEKPERAQMLLSALLAAVSRLAPQA